MPQRIILQVLFADPALISPDLRTLPESMLGFDQIQFRTTVWPPREGHTSQEVDEAIAADTRLYRELMGRARQDPVVSDDPNHPLYREWLNKDFNPRLKQARDRGWEVGYPKAEILRIWIDRNGFARPGGVYMKPDFFLRVARATAPDHWQQLERLVRTWLDSRVFDDLIGLWEANLYRDPNRNKWPLLHGYRPDDLVDLARAYEQSQWNQDHTERLQYWLGRLTRVVPMDEYHWTQEDWRFRWEKEELIQGEHRNYDPWTNQPLPRAWQPAQAPSYQPVLTPVVFVNGLWAFCFQQLFTAIEDKLSSNPCPKCGRLRILARGQRRDSHCDECRKSATATRVRRFREQKADSPRVPSR